MRRTALLAAGILLAAAATARAEDAARPAAPAETSTTTVSPDVGTTQSTRPVTDLEAVKAAVNANDRSAKQIPTIAGIGTIKVVRLSDIEADATDRQVLDSMLSAAKDKVDLLQKAIAGNAALKAALDKERVEPSAIVATRLEADGSLTVFLR